MKGLIISTLLVASVAIAVTPVVSTVYADAYPQDVQKRQALDFCVERNQSFDRLLATDRAACYHRYLPADQPAAQPSWREPRLAANFVDLWQAAGRGAMPQNDVRFEQQTMSALRAEHRD
jgi:hypothetical protein